MLQPLKVWCVQWYVLDIGHVMGIVIRFISNLCKAHWKVVKCILRYLRDTIKKCLYFDKREIKIQGYVNENFVGDVDLQKSTIDCTCIVGTGVVS